MSRATRSSILVGIVLAGAACAGKRIQVPPRLDLARYETVGLVVFTMENAEGTLNAYATDQFASEIFLAQDGVQLLELGSAPEVLDRIGHVDFTPAAVQALGVEYRTPVVFLGHLTVSDVTPRGELLGVRVPRLEATVDAQLTVRLLSTETGATVWRASGSAREQVGEVGLSGGVPFFSAEHPDEAYAELVNRLIVAVTHDLRPTWRRQ